MAAKKVVVRVHFMDTSVRAFGIDAPTTVEQLRNIIIEKLGLKEDGCFSIFERKSDWERCLDPDEKPIDLMKGWEAEKRKEGEDALFLFKKKIFLKLDKDEDRELQDPVAKNLVYIQALYNINEGIYPTNQDDAIKLAGLQTQIVYGDFNSSTHTAGFLTNNSNIKNFIPKALFAAKRPGDWETLVLKEHSRNKGKSAEDAKREYIELAKAQPYYGTTFFPSCKSQNNKNLPSKVVIGVNYEGIRLLKPKNKEPLSEHLFTEICSWSSSSSTFAFEFGTQTDSTKYTFETKQGAIIAATIQTYIDILVQMLKNGSEEEEEESQTGTEQSSEGDE